MTLKLTPEQRQQFVVEGAVCVPAVIPRADIDRMADRLWAALASLHGVHRDRPETWTKEGYAQFGKLARSGAFGEMISPGLRDLLDDVFADRGWNPPQPPAPLMVTFANGRTAWSVPSRSWHLDLGRADEALRQAGKIWADYLRVFTFLAPVSPGGGGTAYVAGSHRAAIEIMTAMADEGVADIRSATIVARMKAESPWIASLYESGDAAERTARLMDQSGELRGAPLRVAEMVGEPGDVMLWHPALVHSIAPNCHSTPRLMLSATIYAKSRQGTA